MYLTIGRKLEKLTEKLFVTYKNILYQFVHLKQNNKYKTTLNNKYKIINEKQNVNK